MLFWTAASRTFILKPKIHNVFFPPQIVHKYLVEKNLSPLDTSAFKEQLYCVWFELYARKGSNRYSSHLLGFSVFCNVRTSGLSSPAMKVSFTPKKNLSDCFLFVFLSVFLFLPLRDWTRQGSSMSSWVKLEEDTLLSDFTTGSSCTCRRSSATWTTGATV